MADNIQTTDRTAANIAIAAKDNAGVLVPRNLLVNTSGADVNPATEDTLSALSAKLPPLALTRTVMLNGVTTTGSGSAFADSGRAPTFSASVSGTGAVSATVTIEARNVASGAWGPYGTMTLSGTTTAGDTLGGGARFMEYRATLTAVSGTGATVTVAMAS